MLGFTETDLFWGGEESKIAVRVFPASESIDIQLLSEIIGLGGDGFFATGSAGLGGGSGTTFSRIGVVTCGRAILMISTDRFG
jgi:hypothetical protein